MLSSSGPAGTCYIETANLDGETNLKIKNSVKETSTFTLADDFRSLRGEVKCEPPNPRLYNFSGSLTMNNNALSVGVDSILLRGAMLRNTDWIVGLVIYTGNDTKLMMNSKEKPGKTTNVERRMTKQIIFIFAMLIVLSAFCTIGNVVEKTSKLRHMWFLQVQDVTSAQSFSRFFTFMVVFSYMVPISLYVSMEMVKVCQCLYINWDLEMFDADSDTPALARTSTLNEELGQIEYVFSDKTGTLTRNIMQFMKCTVGGVIYGGNEDDMDESASTIGARSTTPTPTPMLVPMLPPAGRQYLEVPGSDSYGRGPPSVHSGGTPLLQSSSLVDRDNDIELDDMLIDDSSPHLNHMERKASYGFNDGSLLQDMRSRAGNAWAIREFLTILAVCHTVVPEPDKLDPTKIIYQAASPDEEALVKGARDLGFIFKHRDPDSVTIEADGHDERYQILNVLEFNSTRKRMSVVVRTPTGELKLFTKGADTMVFARLRPNDPFVAASQQHLEKFAQIGLRTLCLARRVLTEAEYAEWNAKYYQASLSLTDRDQKIDDVSELLERDLELVGATAIEDRLQDGVPDTLKALAKGGLKLWVLTGDKQETAINIGFSCGLLDDSMKLIILNETNLTAACTALEDAIQQYAPVAKTETLALVIDGATLGYMLEHQQRFMELARLCATCICCRVSPLQKAQVVDMVKLVERCITLAIGDGANDVGMIQAAHIGIGISGKEGMQAVLASDYAIAQFRFLKRLLLVHGRWSYKRVTKCILYCFYKNSTLAFTSLWFAIYSAFSGQSLYEGWLNSLFNVLFTSAPIVAVATLDQDTNLDIAMQYPQLYKSGQKNTAFNMTVFFGWLSSGLWHSLVVFYVPYTFMEGAAPSGQLQGMWAMGTTVYSALIITITLKLALTVSSWTWPVHLATWGSVGVYLVFLMLYSSPMFLNAAPDMFSVPLVCLRLPAFWLALIITPVFTLFPDFAWKYIRTNYFPSEKNALLEELRQEKKRLKKKGGSAKHGHRPIVLLQAAKTGLRKSFTGFAFAAESGQARVLQLLRPSTPSVRANGGSLLPEDYTPS